MTKAQRQLAWEKVVRETHKRAKLGELLLIAGALLEKIERGKNKKFNAIIFKKTMNFYCKQMKKYEC